MVYVHFCSLNNIYPLIDGKFYTVAYLIFQSSPNTKIVVL